MSYLIPIKTALWVFPIVALLFTLPFVINQYHKYGSISKFRVLIIYSFILYLITVYFLVILPLPKRDSVIYHENMVRLIPFQFISDFIRETSLVINDSSTYLKALGDPCFYTVVFNIFMTIPFGMYLRYYYKCDFKKTVLISFLLSLFFELTQLSGLYGFYKYPYRVFDVDDLLMNTLGGMFGYFIMGSVKRFLPTREKIDEEALKKGLIVTPFRRVVLLGLDFVIYFFLVLFGSLFFKNHYIKFVMFGIYFIVLPFIMESSTLAGRILNVRLEFNNWVVIRLTLYQSFKFLYYFLMPMGMVMLLIKLYTLDLMGEAVFFYALIIGLALIILFYLVNFILLVRNKKMFYDKILGVNIISTIKV